jgi:hypothetical protein
MADYVSNTPVSRPRNTGWEVHWDCNGLVWSNQWGFFFRAGEDLDPIQRPSRIMGRGQHQ